MSRKMTAMILLSELTMHGTTAYCSGTASGTHRLKPVFTLTDSNDKSESITVYSNEKVI